MNICILESTYWKKILDRYFLRILVLFWKYLVTSGKKSLGWLLSSRSLYFLLNFSRKPSSSNTDVWSEPNKHLRWRALQQTVNSYCILDVCIRLGYASALRSVNFKSNEKKNGHWHKLKHNGTNDTIIPPLYETTAVMAWIVSQRLSKCLLQN